MSNILKTLAAGSVSGDYQIERSLRFNSADSAYLSRTPGTSGDTKTFTWSGWIKRSLISSSTAQIFNVRDTVTPAENFIRITDDSGGHRLRVVVAGGNLITNALYRDPSAWYHIVLAVDTTQATDTNRVKLYVNGVRVPPTSGFSTETYPVLDATSLFNSNSWVHYIGSAVSGAYFNGYMADINFVDGAGLTADSFGETNETTGVWTPKRFSGPWNVGTGVNGFYLNFSDNSNTTATTLGKDSSGNGNNWTPSGSPGFSVAAGAGNDSLVDSPTQYGTDTGAGGEVRGNYCTLNAVASAGGPLANGNLDIASSGYAGLSSIYGTIGVSSGKWYWEVTAQNSLIVGIGSAALTATYPGQSGISMGWNVFFDITSAFYVSGGITNSASSGSGSAASAGDVIGVALDMDAGNLYLYKNGTVLNAGNPVATTIPAINMMPAFRGPDTNTSVVNFGQRPFAYTAPSGFKALVTTNLPDPTVVQGDDYFNTLTWSGDNTSPRSFTGVGFQPDFVWIKSRNTAAGHALFDSVRGTGKRLNTENTLAEDASNLFGVVSAFNSDGFSVIAGSYPGFESGDVNMTGRTYVGWNWKANGAGVSNTAGTITSTVSANTTAGISIVTYTGNSASDQTVGHGLGVTPSMIIVKSRGSGAEWVTYHAPLGPNKFLYLNQTTGESTVTGYWGTPSSTTFGIKGGGWANNVNATAMVAYCFAAVEGFSKFGSYTGNGSTDGPFVYTGFRPAFILVKTTNDFVAGWVIYDAKRNPYNILDLQLYPDQSAAEANPFGNAKVDFCSNGFKLRANENYTNGNGNTYIYAAFAEVPFRNSLAR